MVSLPWQLVFMKLRANKKGIEYRETKGFQVVRTCLMPIANKFEFHDGRMAPRLLPTSSPPVPDLLCTLPLPITGKEHRLAIWVTAFQPKMVCSLAMYPHLPEKHSIP